MAFYNYVVEDSDPFMPLTISSDPDILGNPAPTEDRYYDLLQSDGIEELCQVVHDVKVMCGTI